jgi:ABC-type polysaccharide/polyol phosphate transport system ATPase subunit
MSADHAITASPTDHDQPRRPGEGAPLAIEARGLSKAFRIPTNRVDSFKERVVHPFASRDYRELKALDDVSFEIRQGEFFGIVGRNGSGKSTLLKLLASIYRADAGTIRMAGRLAPFIELGVGFNLDLTARENVVLNGVMMGLTPTETRDRLDAVIEFAELDEFIDLKLKNYSSGMLVRLAFSTMMEADADVLLIDEVLAVGDAAFQQKCTDAFHEMKARGKTIVLVTHSMATVEEYCDRAMLIADGKIQELGDPKEVGKRYLRLNFEHGAEVADPTGEAISSGDVELVVAQVEDSAGEALTTVEQGDEVRIRVEVDVVKDVAGLEVGFVIANADGFGFFQWRTKVEGEGELERVAKGRRLSIRTELANVLAPGRYFVHCGIARNQNPSDVALYVHNAIDFVVFGTEPVLGIVAIPHEIEARLEGGEK